ncbi:hypothetical protein DFR64_1311 [Pelolinea submarina]|uniref:Uncharacterized protein n=2 Tax=Pelolinea submarina TaxID=913107 RepID=A0A3E0AIC5_9CHLR|nr:hypothetical protein DFR64_1311 [Pelolinea submarina]
MGIILAASAAGCAKIPAIATETSIPTVTPLSTASLAPTETENPFEGLSICRTWQEAENCPITVADFARLPDFVKANFEGFPKESMKVTFVELIPRENRTSYVAIHALTNEEKFSGTAVATETSTNTKKEYIYGSSLSPIGKPYFFMLEKNPPVVENDLTVVAVFPVNNADGSVGTYTTIVPPWVFKGSLNTPEEQTEANLVRKFEILPYLPPVYEMGKITTSIYRPEDMQGSFIKEIFEDTNDPNGKRRTLFKEWEKTGIIPEELEKLPLFGSDMNADGGVKFSD